MIFGRHINRYYLRFAPWFLLGLLSLIAVDAFKKLVRTPLDDIEMEKFFELLERVSEAHHCNFVLSISVPEDEVPEYIRKYTV